MEVGREREERRTEADTFLWAPPPRTVIQKIFTGVLEIWVSDLSPMHPNEEMATNHILKSPRLSGKLTTPTCFTTGMQRNIVS